MKQQTDPSERRYETDWMVTTTQPVYNRASKRWESKIISTDSDGNEFSYGFDRRTPSTSPTNVVSSPTSQTSRTPQEPSSTLTTPREPEPTTTSADRVKEIRGLISDLREDAKAGLISKEDYARMVKELTSKISKGGNI